MAEPQSVWIVWCESDPCRWGPQLTASTTETEAAMIARWRDSESEACGPHHVAQRASASVSGICDAEGCDSPASYRYCHDCGGGPDEIAADRDRLKEALGVWEACDHNGCGDHAFPKGDEKEYLTIVCEECVERFHVALAPPEAPVA